MISEGVAARLGMPEDVMRRLEKEVRKILRLDLRWKEKPLAVSKAVRVARSRFKNSSTVRRWSERIHAILIGKST